MSCRVTRSGKKYVTSDSIRRKEKARESQSALSKTARKRLGLWTSGVEESSLTEESVLEEIFQLSPVSPVKRCRENVKPSTALCRGILSPLKALSLRSPEQKKSSDPVFTIKSSALQNRLNSVLLDRKFDFPIPKLPLKTSAEIKTSPKPQKSSPKRAISAPKTEVTSPNKKKKQDNEENEENTPPVRSPKKSPKKVPQFGTRVVLRELQNVPVQKPLSDVIINTPTPVQENLEIISTSVKTPRTQKAKKLDKTAVFNSVKNALHNAAPKRLIGRESELKEIEDFIEDLVETKKSGSLYISGAPGTGKSACLSQALSDPKVTSKLAQSISINCMSVRTASQIYQQIATEMGANSKESKSARTALKFIENDLTTRESMILLLLDEMDQLDSRNHEVLYTMFGWSALPNSKVILIGIANSLDLTDRILPRLQARLECKPKLLNFKPYSKDQLANILQARISKASRGHDDIKVVDAMAVQFCARKIAATSGDARKALDVCRRAVELVETNSLGNTAESTTKVGIRQISSVMDGVYGNVYSSHGGATEADDAFPLQQKLVVCSLLLLCKKTKSYEAPLGKLRETYTTICKDRQVSAVSQSEFHSLCDLVEARGLVSLRRHKQPRLAKIKLNVDEKEIEFALKGKALLSSILQRGISK
uniref:cell division control protein 6 homolog n=1 Tax=Ciona intestinalis TaxID=7719 RepID=UPI000180B725|nr:cell division control protein 6 homolog [Ciona intestinalis]|eukprot:XP_002119530.1 cell division control protein 6 homolog [Ciona intestinalis]